MKLLYKINFLELSFKELQTIFIKLNLESYRVIQVIKWIYHNYCNDFNLMTNLNLLIKNKLQNTFNIILPKIIKQQISLDNTRKWLLQLTDNNVIEVVYIPDKLRGTLCISSQIGCKLKCIFCYSGRNGFIRNLTVSEIIGQIICIKKILKEEFLNNKLPKITNIVFMGSGEPLLNFKNLIKAINILTDPLILGISNKKIIISTTGIVPELIKLADYTNVKLTISLHASNNCLRSKLIPINNKYNINMVLEAAKYYFNHSYLKKKITIAYIMLKGINDSKIHAYQLIKILSKIPCKINLIPLNKIDSSLFNTSSYGNILNFYNILKKHGFITTIRKSKGQDINAACGQLIGKQ